MSAIAGIINCREELLPGEILNAMCGMMRHRGPGGFVKYTVPGTALGYRHLAHSESDRVTEVLSSEEKGLFLVMDGEIANAQELRRELESKGHRFASSAGAEVLIHLYEESGKAFVTRLEGAFAFALYDSVSKKILLGRDMPGQKPLYYFRRQKELVFASELAALKCHPLFPETLDPEALADYFSLLYIPQPGTVYKEVFHLPPGSLMEFDSSSGEMTILPWFRTDFSKKVTGSREELAEELRRLVFKAVEKRLTAKGTAGAFLSGGIDSNITCAAAAELLKTKGGLKVCTVGFAEKLYDERPLARKGAEFINARTNGTLLHRERELSIGDFDLVKELTAHCGQPYADSSLLPSALLCAFAKEEMTAALSGDGADELFGGYERYIAMAAAEKFDRIPRLLRQTALKGISLFPEGGERSFAGRLKRFLRVSCEREEDRYFAVLDRCPSLLRQRLFSPGFKDSLRSSGAERFRRHGGITTTLCRHERYSETDLHTYLPGDTLPKADISSMAHGLEVRSPFFDPELMSFAFSLPWEMKICGRERKSLLKYAFRDLLAPEVLTAPKKGFGVPVAALLRTRWRKAAEELLFEGALQNSEFLQRDTLRGLWQEHLSGKKDHSYILWSILIFGIFLEQQR